MLDISFSEIAVIGAVALVVLGPERLPKVARTAGHLFGRLQRYVATVKADINREMEGSELAKVRQEVQEAARSFETTVRAESSAIESETQALSNELEKTAVDAAKPVLPPTLTTPPSTIAVSANSVAPSPSPSQAELLFAQEAGMLETPASTETFGVIRFDLGIEPIRTRHPG
jgi:sec-independent protein translocase protein TatB